MILELEKAVGVAQHHDAITGTERQRVAEDYHRRLSSGIEMALAGTVSQVQSIFSIQISH